MTAPIKASTDITASSTTTDDVMAEEKTMEPFWFLNQTIFLICSFVLVYYCVYMSVHLLAISYGFLNLHSWKPQSQIKLENWPGVSLIKPIIGNDSNLKENLESYFKINYPKYEILICIAEHESSGPPSLPIIEELRLLYPHVCVKVFMGANSIGVNPKINNIFNAYQSAEYDLLWISDSNILTQPDNLTEMVCKAKHPRVALVHQLPYIASVHSFAGYLDKVYFGTQHSRVYLWANLIGQNCATGMSWLIKKSAVDNEGGLKVFSEYLAEDFFIGKALWTRGWKFALSSIPVLQNPGSHSLSGFQTRVIRWGRLRASMMPLPVLFEPFTECLLLGVVGSLSVHYIIGWNRVFFFLCHCVFWFMCDLILIHLVENGQGIPLWKLLLVWLFREIWTFPLYVASTWSREITWRGVRYRLKLGGQAIKID